MNFNSLILYATFFLLLMIGFSVMTFLYQNRRRSPESIYKLIDELEKKYIY